MKVREPGHRLFTWYATRGLALGFSVGAAAGLAVVVRFRRRAPVRTSRGRCP